MCREPLPKEDVARSLATTVLFAKTVLPLLKVACDHVKAEMGQMPPGGARHDRAERQIAPALIRVRMHQLIQGHNIRCAASGEAPLSTHRIRNGAVCLLQRGFDYRLLKESKRYPTRPSGCYQEGLINQERYWSLVNGPYLNFGETTEDYRPLLEGLIYYQYWNWELHGAYVVIPDGFTADNRVNVADSEPIELYDLEDLARFESAGFIDTAVKGESLLISDMPLDPQTIQDPFYEADLVAEAALDEVLESEGTKPSVLEQEESDRSND